MRKKISRVKKSIKHKSRPKNTKTVAKKSAAPAKVKKIKPIGVVTHYYGGLKVAIIKFKRVFKAGEKVWFKGATTDFKGTVKSIQYDYKPVKTAKKGQQVGVRVNDKVREGDFVFEA